MKYYFEKLSCLESYTSTIIIKLQCYSALDLSIPKKNTIYRTVINKLRWPAVL